MRENELQNKIRAAIGFDYAKTVRLFRNNVGMINGVQFGLCKGSSDLIGFTSKTITLEMVGEKIAVFTALEIKAPTGGKVSKEQTAFLNCVQEFGGIGAVVRSVEQAKEALK